MALYEGFYPVMLVKPMIYIYIITYIYMYKQQANLGMMHTIPSRKLVMAWGWFVALGLPH